MRKIILLFCIAGFLPFLCFSQEQIDRPQYILYLPKGLEQDKTYPLVVALSPSADATAMINAWKPAADKFKWIILASKEFKNGIDMLSSMSSLAALIEEILKGYPADKAKVILTGFSGGAMGAHAFAYAYPSMVNTLIINTGMIHEYYLERKSNYPRYKAVVFLASPADFRYNEMKRDRQILESVGWTAKWIEFEGGHVLAPSKVYLEAATWVDKKWQEESQAEEEAAKKDSMATANKAVLDKFIVSGIIFNPKGKSIAIVNGETLKEGDRFNGLLMVKIRENSVVVIINGEKGVLNLQ